MSWSHSLVLPEIFENKSYLERITLELENAKITSKNLKKSQFDICEFWTLKLQENPNLENMTTKIRFINGIKFSDNLSWRWNCCIKSIFKSKCTSLNLKDGQFQNQAMNLDFKHILGFRQPLEWNEIASYKS